MNKYLESIESMEQVGTDHYSQNTPNSSVLLEASLDAPFTTSTEFPIYENSTQSLDSYEAPKKVIVRIYRLRK